MISSSDIYHVVAATIPLYVAMILAYVSVKWWKIFTPEQCSGINKFVAKFSIPLLSFQIISTNNPYHMNLKLILSDFLQKLLAILLLGLATRVWFRSWSRLDSIITGLSLSTLPNTLILGIPLLRAMYGGEAAESLLSQIVFLQSIVWYNLLLFLFELHVARRPPTETAEGDRSNEEEAKDDDMGREVKTVRILIVVGKKLMRNPNFYATLIGFIWACIHFRWGVKLPEIIDKSIMILATGGLGMAMFSLGLFMASRGSIIACGIKMAGVAMVMKFVAGPALMAISALTVGLRGTVLRVAIVQAALPQGIVPFVFAKEYNVNPDILSTAVLFGMFIVLPISLAYYSLLAL
ncbi:Auxin efflux carrier component 8 [Linum grandiflorum]